MPPAAGFLLSMHRPGQSAVQNPSASLAIKSDTRTHHEKTCLHGAADLPMRLARQDVHS
jgi:hypothetical protein